MSRNDNSMYSSHDEVLILLPWYVNESLDEKERGLVEKHLKVCLRCRVEVTNLQHLSESVVQSEFIDMAANASFARFKERIQGQPESQETKELTSHSKSVLGYCKHWLEHHPRSMVGISAGIVFFILALSFFLADPTILPELMTPAYRTLGNPSSDNRSAHHDIRVVFANGLDPSQIERILNSIDGKIVADHSREGVVRIRFTDTQDDFQKAIEAISVLRKRSDVIFAEPAFTLSSRDNLKRAEK